MSAIVKAKARVPHCRARDLFTIPSPNGSRHRHAVLRYRLVSLKAFRDAGLPPIDVHPSRLQRGRDTSVDPQSEFRRDVHRVGAPAVFVPGTAIACVVDVRFALCS